MPVPLKRTDKQGTLFTRPAEIEACIALLEKLDGPQRLEQFESFSRKHPHYVPNEAVLYFLRRASREGDQAGFRKVFGILIRRVEYGLRGAVPDARMENAADIREAVQSNFVMKLTLDCNEQEDLLDFFEVRFDKAMAAIRVSVLREIGPTRLGIQTLSLGSLDDDGPEVSPEVEAALEDFLSGDPQKIDDPAFRSVFFSAIDRLPTDQKQVIGLMLQGIPAESQNPNIKTIAQMLNCDVRTIRNRKARAYKMLRVILEQEAEL